MSGGVDSSVTAYLLKEQGYKVTGLFMQNWQNEPGEKCTSEIDFKDASNVCDKLDKVVGIKTPMMIASGTIIDNKIIVTNRHVVEDHKQFVIKFNNGVIKKAF